MNIRRNDGITIITLVITIVLLLIISGISITGTLRGHEKTEETLQISELNMIQHAILERYTKAQLTNETLPGENIGMDQVQAIISEINQFLDENERITLKGSEYKKLSKNDLRSLGIKKEKDIYIVNYKTGEVINSSKKVTTSGKALYIYSKESED